VPHGLSDRNMEGRSTALDSISLKACRPSCSAVSITRRALPAPGRRGRTSTQGFASTTSDAIVVADIGNNSTAGSGCGSRNAAPRNRKGCFAHLLFSHPAGDHRLVRLVGQFDHRSRRLGPGRSSLGGEDGEYAVDIVVNQAGGQGLQRTCESASPTMSSGLDLTRSRQAPGSGCPLGFLAEYRQRYAQVRGVVGGHDAGPRRW